MNCHSLRSRARRALGRFIIAAVSAPVVLAAPPDSAQNPAPLYPDAFGNVIPDFSLAGYRNGGVALPVAPVVETVNPAAPPGDDTARIQAAIDRVAARPPRADDGVSGAVLLTKGAYRCGESLHVPPGVTLRGEGADVGGTVITATMIPAAGASPTLIRVEGRGDVAATGQPHAILDEAVPLGAHRLRLANATEFKPGELVLIERASTPQWIHELQMDQIKLKPGGQQWTAAGYRMQWWCHIAAVHGAAVTVDAPVLCAIENRYGGGAIRKAEDTRRGAAAVERLRLVSVYAPGQENSDERHAWNAITLNNVVDSWVRKVTAVHFAYSCVTVGKRAAALRAVTTPEQRQGPIWDALHQRYSRDN